MTFRTQVNSLQSMWDLRLLRVTVPAVACP